VEIGEEMQTTVLNTSSMTGSQFWTALKTQADTIAWNLLDVRRNGTDIPDGVKPSIERAYTSAERLLSLVSGRMEDFKRQQVVRRVSRTQ
jgi:hypothetical protein